MTTLTTNNAERVLAGFKIQKASELPDELGYFFVLYGQGGSGKTTLAAEAAKLGPTLEIDAEGGADAIKHRSDVDVVNIFKYQDFEKLTRELVKGEHGYTNIIVDNLVELAGMKVTEVTGNARDAVEIQEWGMVTREILYQTRVYRDTIARKQGVNVFFLCWDADEKDDRGVLKKDLAFTPALRREFPGIVTIIGHVAVTKDPTKRMLNFAPGPKTVSKFRRSGDSAANKIPFQIYYGLDNLPMADIIRTMKGEIEWPSKKYPVPGNSNKSDDD